MSGEMTKFRVNGITRTGVSIGEFLAVAKPYRDHANTYLVYALSPSEGKILGKPYGPEFKTEKDAIAFAILINQIYGEWLPLLIEYFQMDIIEVAKFSVGYDFTKNCYINHSGLRLAEAWEKFCQRNSPVTLSEFRILYEQTQA